jgi:hypothetical protein
MAVFISARKTFPFSHSGQPKAEAVGSTGDKPRTATMERRTHARRGAKSMGISFQFILVRIR